MYRAAEVVLLVRYYTSRKRLQKIRLLCGSIAVTIATHKNRHICIYRRFNLMWTADNVVDSVFLIF